MNPLEQLLASDPNVAPAFKRIFANPRADVLTVAHDKAAPRRFTGEPPTGFGTLNEELPMTADEIAADNHQDYLRWQAKEED